MTAYYPVALDLRGRLCVVIGGGGVAERKVHGLLECNGRVRVIAPKASPKLRKMAVDGLVNLEVRQYRTGDLAGAFLAMGATDDPQVNDAVFQEAQEKGILVNIADAPSRCNFILPATVRRGDLTIAINTGGKSPALARQIREDLEEQFPPEFSRHLEELACYRRLLRESLPDPAHRETAWRGLMAGGLVDLLRRGETQKALSLVQDAVTRAGDAR